MILENKYISNYLISSLFRVALSFLSSTCRVKIDIPFQKVGLFVNFHFFQFRLLQNSPGVKFSVKAKILVNKKITVIIIMKYLQNTNFKVKSDLDRFITIVVINFVDF